MTSAESSTPSQRWYKWRTGPYSVYSQQQLNGGGIRQAPMWVRYLRTRFEGRRFRRVFEWCSGPSYIGFTLLAQGLCDELCAADINPRAIACVERTARLNGLQDRVSCYVSDNLDDVPSSEKFDLVVANPPNFVNLNPRHPRYEELRHSILVNDRGWKVHKKFYSQIGAHLRPGAYLAIAEVEIRAKRVFLGPPNEPVYDRRPKPPIEDFQRMIRSGGLELVGTETYWKVPGLPEQTMVISRRPRSGSA